MATYVEEVTRGHTLHLLKFDTFTGTTPVYLDATKTIKAAQQKDNESGYPNGGPAMALEIEKARTYADYVARHASPDNLHQFNTGEYQVFTEAGKPLIPQKIKRKNPNVLTHVSV